MADVVASILINNYNYGRFLAEAIDSALAAADNCPGTEVVVVDDGSTDDSRDVIARYAAADPRVVPVLKPNGGQASAFNAGFAASRGEFLLLLDSDDLCLPDRVAQVVDAFRSRPQIGWCFHRMRRMDPDGSVAASFHVCHGGESREVDFRARMRRAVLPTFAPATSGLCFRRSLLGQILPMPEGESVSISDHYVKYLAVALAEGYCLEKPLGVMRVHGGNVYSHRTTDDKARLAGRINVNTAYWLRRRLPELTRYADKLMGIGLGTFARVGGAEPKCRRVVDEYKSECSPMRRALIALRAAYHASGVLAKVRAWRHPKAQLAAGSTPHGARTARLTASAVGVGAALK
jgi:glycosyltransferase involved in cell wall biosynthesis